MIFGLIGWGIYSLQRIPIDAVPDITTNQVQVITKAPTLAAQEVEQFITFPLEISMSNLPDVVEIRSISRFGISVITIVFEDQVDIYHARQLISEQLKLAEMEIPSGFGQPTLGPITTGLGEVYQYVIHADEEHKDQYTDMELRTINDWIVQRQLAGIPGVIEVNGWGGHLKQYEVAVDPERLNGLDLTLAEVFSALESNNENTGGSYIEKDHRTYFIRGEGLVQSLEDIESIVVRNDDGVPLLIRDVAEVGFGHAPRYGAVTYNGQGEVVSGQILMLKGENSYETVQAVKERVEQVRKSLPEGVVLEAFIDRSKLISNAIQTVTTNLLEGGLIVIFVLVLLLGNWRGGLIVASVIPLSMMFAVGMMNLFGISANLMSLGAIDFGLVVDGSVIIVEAILHRLSNRKQTGLLSVQEMDDEVNAAASKIRKSAAFGEIIILIVYLPILALVGIEGKMFAPMAQTVSFAILGALILSMTYVPMMSALFLQKDLKPTRGLSERIIEFFHKLYVPALNWSLKFRGMVVVISIVLFGICLWTFNRLGGEFIPTLEEGDFALHQILPPGSSLEESVHVSEKIQNALLENFPEVEIALSKIGTAEIATDPMPIEVGDIILKMKPMDEWTTADNREEMFEKMEEVLTEIPGVGYEFTQPIQMRFNELIAGVREDIAIKIYGEDPAVLYQYGERAESLIKNIQGVGDVRLEETQGLPQMIIRYDRAKIAQYGLKIKQVNTLIRSAFAGEVAGVVFEGEKRFDLVVRLDRSRREDLDDLRGLYVPLSNGGKVPLMELAEIKLEDGPAQISRENAKRRIVVGVNARDRDTESLVEEIQSVLDQSLDLPAGYYLDYGGQFENMMAARQRLSVAVPIALLLIMILLYFTFNSLSQALLIFTAIPLSAIGGVFALWVRDMPFSISAGIGFIALFGVAVLNGIVLVAYFNQLEREGVKDVVQRIKIATEVRLRPVLLTAFVAALGFLPMALSSSAGAEVQRPLATVVIGGLISATILTLVVLPVLYSLWTQWSTKRVGNITAILALLFLLPMSGQSQVINVDQAVQMALSQHPSMEIGALEIDQERKKKGQAWELDPTSVQYSRGQMNTEVIDYQWQIQQRFRFPTTYIRQNAAQNARIEESEINYHLRELHLQSEVRLNWWDLAYHQSRVALYADLETYYQGFANAADSRFEQGDIGGLERARSKAELNQMLLQSQKARSDYEIAISQLAQWIGSDTNWVFPPNELKPLLIPMNAEIDSLGYPQLALQQKRIAASDQEYRLAKSRFMPDLMVGYFNQSLEEVPGMDGIQLGISAPIFFWGKQSESASAKRERAIEQARYEEMILVLKAEETRLWKELEKYQGELNWYEETGEDVAEELQKFALKAYENGAIGYVEFLDSLEESRRLKEAHLLTLMNYNQTIVQLQFLHGTF